MSFDILKASLRKVARSKIVKVGLPILIFFVATFNLISGQKLGFLYWLAVSVYWLMSIFRENL